MVKSCANPECGKPLHYLREGRVFLFNVPDPNTPAGAKRVSRIEHFWLCGECSQTMLLTQTSEKTVRLIPKIRPRQATLLKSEVLAS